MRRKHGTAARSAAAEIFPHGQGPGCGWQLVWHDEFEGDAVDTTKWDFDLGSGFYDCKNHAWVAGWMGLSSHTQ